MSSKDLLSQIRKEFGEESMFLLGLEERLMDIKVRSSGSLLLDVALGGGFPMGRPVELAGLEKSGKTTLLCMAIASAQQNEPHKECAVIDTEHAFNPDWARRMGVDLSKLYFAQPDTSAEKVYDLIEYLVKTGNFSIIGLDSLAGLIPREELEEDDWTKESRVGGTSRINSKMIRKIVNSGILTASETTFICINQLRDKIGGFSPYGPTTQTPGGRSLRFAYSQQLDVAIGDYFTKGTGPTKEYLGQQIKVKVSKNKIAPPFRLATVDVYYEEGIDRLTELVSVAKKIGVLAGTSWLTVCDPVTGEVFKDATDKDLKFNGVGKVREALVEDIEQHGGVLYNQIFDLVQTVIRG